MHTVTLTDSERTRTISAEDGALLYDLLIEHGISINAPCGGRCFCGKCKLRVSGAGQPELGELGFLTPEEQATGTRLACAVYVHGDIQVWLPDAASAQILADGLTYELTASPSVTARALSMPAPTLKDQRSDARRLLEAAQCDADISHGLLATLPDRMRALKFGGYAMLFEGARGARLAALSESGVRYGVAVDIGTTTMVAYLVDLSTGRQLDAATSLNPQRAFGADVISRTDYTINEADGLDTLSALVVERIQSLIALMAERQGIALNDIYHVVAVGNTIMMHLYARSPVRHIAVVPFVPAYSRGFDVHASELGFDLPSAHATVTPCVAGYVGSDTLAALLSCGMDQKEGVSLMIDIGTNGEIALGGRGRMLACSTAAGPAFEGAHIRCGTGGVVGAINTVKLDHGEVRVTTIGGAPAIGICGSGLVDAVAALLNAGILDAMGRIQPDEAPESLRDRFIQIDGKPAFVLHGEGDGAQYLCQRDLREVQLAKGAIAAGIEVLMRELGVGYDDIQALYLSGGFGNYIDRASACAIGLLPPQLAKRIHPIGNGAGMGARMMLSAREDMARVQALSERIEYIELSNSADFQDLFVERMMFGEE